MTQSHVKSIMLSKRLFAYMVVLPVDLYNTLLIKSRLKLAGYILRCSIF